MTRTSEFRPAGVDHPPLELVRSTRRRRTVSAFMRNGRLVVQLPAGLPETREQELIGGLVDKVTGAARAADAGGVDELHDRARELADRYLDGVRPTSVVWSSRMERRYGSCTTATGRIRISDRLKPMPRYVLDSVLVHELAHLLVPDHSARFHELVARYPDHERARGFLEGVQYAAARDGFATGASGCP